MLGLRAVFALNACVFACIMVADICLHYAAGTTADAWLVTISGFMAVVNAAVFFFPED
jgi:hypothetical protein